MNQLVAGLFGVVIVLAGSSFKAIAEQPDAGHALVRPETVSDFLLDLNYLSSGSDRFVGPLTIGCPDGSLCYIHDVVMPTNSITVDLSDLPRNLREAAVQGDTQAGTHYVLLLKKKSIGLAEVTAEKAYYLVTGKEVDTQP